jgi:hypothetical protein
MCLCLSITPKTIEDLLDEVGSVKAEPVARLECFATAPLGALRDWEHCDSATGPEDIRRGRRNLGTRFDEILPPPSARSEKCFEGSYSRMAKTSNAMRSMLDSKLVQRSENRIRPSARG